MIRPAKNRVLMRIVLKLSPAISYCMVFVYARQQQQPQICNPVSRDRWVPAIRDAPLPSVNDVDSTVKGAQGRRTSKCSRSVMECRRVAMDWDSARLPRAQLERP